MMISVVILTKNEEKHIADCLKSVLWADEVLVIDDHSEDNTATLARKNGAQVYSRGLDGDFSTQRNFGLEKAQGEWVLFLDADERVPKSLRKEILANVEQSSNKYDGYCIKRTDFLFGKQLKHGETGSSLFLRLAKRGRGKWSGRVHEVWNVEGLTANLQESLAHYPHETISEFLSDINLYTTMRADELYEQKVHAGFLSIILHTKGKFFQNYLLKLGFLDGIPGIISALMMSFHAFLVRSKLWLLWQKNQKTV